MRHIKRLYDWVLSWANTPYGGTALVLLSFAESSFFPIPPDVLLIALCLGNRERWFRFASLCTAASVVGGLAGYGIGWGLWHAVDQLFFTYVPGFTEEQFAKVQGLYERWNFWVVFVAAFTPIPYKVITVSAGVFGINMAMFMIASVVGRAARFFLVAYLLHRYGEPIHAFIEKRFNLLTIVFVILLIGGFAVLRYAAH
ncbi:MAG: DedA family protein [Candidatus Hydrogenedentes bacterium]|nr:DedA family protein [Candidatus Hydrogenedentota bacterium]